ncbi:MAG: hypothetical protein V4489_05615 [Chlamydiota bacterium]
MHSLAHITEAVGIYSIATGVLFFTSLLQVITGVALVILGNDLHRVGCNLERFHSWPSSPESSLKKVFEAAIQETTLA